MSAIEELALKFGELAPEFERLGKGNDYKGIILALARTFPASSTQIFANAGIQELPAAKPAVKAKFVNVSPSNTGDLPTKGCIGCTEPKPIAPPVAAPVQAPPAPAKQKKKAKTDVVNQAQFAELTSDITDMSVEGFKAVFDSFGDGGKLKALQQYSELCAVEFPATATYEELLVILSESVSQ